MEALQALIRGDMVHRLGWTLVHSVWLTAAVAALLAVVQAALRRRSAQASTLLYARSNLSKAIFHLSRRPDTNLILRALPPPFDTRKYFDDTMGTSVSATTRDASSEKETVSAISLKTSAAIPSTNTTGTKTATVVSVDATTAMEISSLPSRAASSLL